MKKRVELSLKNTWMEIIKIMSEGVPGAVTVLVGMIGTDPDSGIYKILIMDDMNIRGRSIWIGYKDYCNQDIKKFMEAVVKRDPAMVTAINKELGKTVAVERGASKPGD